MGKTSIAAVLLLAGLALAGGSAAAQEAKGSTYTKIPTVKGTETLKAGAVAPDFTLRDLENREFRLKDAAGKDAVLLFFWSFFCGPCREELPLINQMTRDFRGKGLRVLGVNLDGPEMKKAIDKFVASEKIEFRIVFDELSGDAFLVADPYGVAGTPALFLIDRKGVITFSAVGAVADEKLRKELESATK